jgi:membrane peptidoglycan carboxypeptidase
VIGQSLSVLVPDGGRRPRTLRRTHRVRSALLLVALASVCGVLVAGLAFPLVGSLGLVARAGADSFEALPDELVEPPLPQTSRILAADGSTLAVAYFNENRVVVPLSSVPQVMRDAILAIEDYRFYEHGGLDFKSLVRAVVRNSQAGEVQQGGSTITQQYVKNVLIARASNGGARRAVAERTAARKISEANYAIALEQRYTKDQILEKYLNIAYFGSGVYGVGTAARYYFGIPVEKLTLRQSALLAGLVKNPRLYDPVRHPKNAKERRNVVLSRMEEVGFAPAAAVARAKKLPLGLKITRERGFEDNPVAPMFLDYVRSTILDDPDGRMAPIFGSTQQERAQALFQGGLTIRTTLDPRLQRVAQQSLKDTLGEKTDPASAAVVVQPGTGQIKVMAGLNHERRTRKVNLAVGGGSGFQAGSTFKVFVLAAAIEQGIPLTTLIRSPQTYRSKVFKTTNPETGAIEPYEVGNAGDSEAGVFDLVSATWHSVNTAYMQLEEKTGISEPARIARELGVTRFPVREVPSLVLGANEVSPLDMAGAYATLAARGLYCAPVAISEVVDASGRVLGRIEPACRQAMAAETADVVTSVLRGVVTDGTGKNANIGRPVAGKTGTTNGPTAAWFDGYTPDFAGAVWVGHPTDPAKRPLRWVKGVPIVYGGGFPATIWRTIMLAAHEGLPVRDFLLPPAVSRPVGPLVAPKKPEPKKPADAKEPEVAPTAPAPLPKDCKSKHCRRR